MAHIFKKALDNECIIYKSEHCFNSLLMHLLEIQMLDSEPTVVTIFFPANLSSYQFLMHYNQCLVL
jgi:hypothetical protein